MEADWMTEAAREYGAQIRNEDLSKKAAKDLTGLSERKTRQLVDFIKSMTDDEFEELTAEEAAAEEVEATTTKAEKVELSPMKRAIRDFRRGKLNEEEFAKLALDHLIANDEGLYKFFEGQQPIKVLNAGYKWIDLRVTVSEANWDDFSKHLATNLKTHGKLAWTKFYKPNIEQRDEHRDATIQLRVA